MVDEQIPEGQAPLSGEVMNPAEEEKLRNLAQLVYILQAISLVVGLTGVGGGSRAMNCRLGPMLVPALAGRSWPPAAVRRLPR